MAGEQRRSNDEDDDYKQSRVVVLLGRGTA
jgi:hypothetical protein